MLKLEEVQLHTEEIKNTENFKANFQLLIVIQMIKINDLTLKPKL